MPILVDEVGRLERILEQSKDSLKQILKLREKIDALMPEERIAILIRGQSYNLINRANLSVKISSWLENVLEFADKRAIVELKDESIWETDSYKEYITIANKLVEEFGYEMSEKFVDLVIPDLKEIWRKGQRE